MDLLENPSVKVLYLFYYYHYYGYKKWQPYLLTYSWFDI